MLGVNELVNIEIGGVEVIKYYVKSYGTERISKVEIERESDSFVWINGRRSAIRSRSEGYFNTWKEAHDFLISEATGRYDRAKREFDTAAAILNKVVEYIEAEE